MIAVVLDTNTVVSALAARTKYLVTRDDDLLVLGKPFGIAMITPTDFLVWLRQGHRSAT